MKTSWNKKINIVENLDQGEKTISEREKKHEKTLYSYQYRKKTIKYQDHNFQKHSKTIKKPNLTIHRIKGAMF